VSACVADNYFIYIFAVIIIYYKCKKECLWYKDKLGNRHI
jgi:hypothetical protein